MNTELRFLDTVRREGILPEGARIVAAVSGGSDSVAMLHLLLRFRDRLDWDLSVLHVDHHARPDSGSDALFVRELAIEAGLGFDVRHLPGPAGDERADEAAMSRGRQAIYGQLSADRPGLLVAVGHTMDDRAETLLLRLAEGAGVRGLGGMDYRGIGPVRRPLLDLCRSELREYLETQGAAWREDPSNLDPSFRRNRVRNELLPLYESICPGVTSRIARTASMAASWRDFLDRQMVSVIADLTSGPQAENEASLDRGRYTGLPAALRLGVLWTLCGRPRFGALELEKADRWICSGKSGEHPLPGGAGMTADRDNIRIEGRPDRESTEEG